MAWDDNQEAQDVKNAWWNLRQLLNTRLPGHRQRLYDLAHRPTRG